MEGRDEISSKAGVLVSEGQIGSVMLLLITDINTDGASLNGHYFATSAVAYRVQ